MNQLHQAFLRDLYFVNLVVLAVVSEKVVCELDPQWKRLRMKAHNSWKRINEIKTSVILEILTHQKYYLYETIQDYCRMRYYVALIHTCCSEFHR